MATKNTAFRNLQAEVFRALDRIEFLATDDTTVLATISVTLGAASGGATSGNPDATTYDTGGTIKSARAYDADGSSEITGLKVVDSLGNDWNGVAQADAFIALNQVGLAVSSGATVDLTLATYTTSATFVG